jgi:predicted esterase
MRPFLGLAAVFTLALVSCKQEAPAPSNGTSAQTNAPASATPVEKAIQLPGIPIPAAGSSDWLKQAYQVKVMTPVDNKADSKVELGMAWTPAALLLHVHSNDMTPAENAPDTWNDSVEVFLASSPGSDDRIHYIFSPARSAKPPSPAFKVDDKRQGTPNAVAPDFHTDKSDTGYDMTISIPWANLKHVPLANEIIGLQIYVNDAQTNGQISRRIWYPQMITFDQPDAMNKVQLTGQADAPETTAIWLQGRGVGEALHVSALDTDAGKKIVVWSAGKQIAEGQLQAGGPDGSTAEIPLAGEIETQKDAALTVTMDGATLPGVLKMPDMMKRRLDLVKRLPLIADPSIFSTPIFPKIDFKNREVVEAAFGPYELKIRFFDANWNEVTVPDKPGRYGAVVEFDGENNLTFKRNLTLFKTPQNYILTKDPYNVTVKFPEAFGLPADIGTKEQWIVSESVNSFLEGLSYNERSWAPVIAGLHDLAADPGRWHGYSTWTIDNVWWTELRKRLGENQDYPHLTQLPADYDKDSKKAWPLLLFLHGSGERGDDLNKLKNQGPYGYIQEGHSLPFIVIEPQCPLEQSWDASRLMNLIDQTAAAYRVDPKRIYVTGLSMGGFGTLELAATYPDRITAIASLSGGDNPELAARLKKMPTWLFHGDIDTVVPTSYSTDLYHAMQKVGAPVKMTVYPGVGHWGWQKTYSDPALYAWLLQQSK